jgi:hypothetical protein
MKRKVGIGWYETDSPVQGVKILGYNLILSEKKALPSGMGKWMFGEAKRLGLDKVLKKIQTAEGSLVWYRMGCICPFCGNVDQPPPEGIDAAIAGYGSMNPKLLLRNISAREQGVVTLAEEHKQISGYPDPNSVIHTHKKTPPEDPFCQGNEIVFILGTDGMEVWSRKVGASGYVYAAQAAGDDYNLKMIQRFGAGEPDWAIMDELVKEER